MKSSSAIFARLGVVMVSFFLLWPAFSFLRADEMEPEATSDTTLTNILAPLTNQVPEQESVTADQAWRSFLQIQGQLDTALLAIERNRRESEATSLDNQKRVNENLKSIEKVLQAQQEREMVALRESNRNLLIVAGAFAGVGFLTMLLTSFFHLRAMNRLASIATAFPMGQSLGMGAAGLLGQEQEHLLAVGSGNAPGQRLLWAIEKLEKRIVDLEHTSHLPAAEGDGKDHPSKNGPAGDEVGPPGISDQLSMLLGKGQALLNLGKAEEALVCFDQALDRQPQDAETLVKKGSALEKLGRLDEAIDCYDQAIAANQGMTLAYLYKGGLFNRMERYNEALACYEQALKTQQSPEAAQEETGMEKAE